MKWNNIKPAHNMRIRCTGESSDTNYSYIVGESYTLDYEYKPDSWVTKQFPTKLIHRKDFDLL